MHDLQVQKIERGQKIPREEIPAHLYLVLEGEVSIRSKAGLEMDRLKTGRSLELRPLMLGEKAWQFDWVAEAACVYIRVPWGPCAEGLKKNAEAYSYLGRMASSVILQKTKRDMRGIGMTYEAVVKIISKLKFDTIENIVSKAKMRVFCIIQTGEVHGSVELNSQRRKVVTYQAGDALLLDLMQRTVQYQGGENNRLWYLVESDWVESGLTNEFRKYLDVFSNVANGVSKDEIPVLPVEEQAVERVFYEVESQELSWQAKLRFHLWKVFPPFMEVSYGDDRSVVAIVATLSSYLGYPMGQRRADAKVKGLISVPSLDSLEKLSIALGFECHFFNFENIPENETIWPLIVHMDTGLKIIFATFKEDAIVGDPDTGQVNLVNLKEFQSRRVDKRAINLVPGSSIKKRPDPDVPTESFLELLFGKKKWVALFFAAGSLGYLFELILPVLIQYLFDSVIMSKETHLLAPTIAVYIFFSLTSSWLASFNQKLTSDIASYFVLNVKNRILKRVSILPIETFRGFGTSGIVSRLNELDQMGLVLTSGVFNSVLSLFLIFGSLSVLWLYHHTLVYVVLAAVPIEMLFSFLFRTRIERVKIDEARVRAQENRMLMEHFTSAEDMKSLKGQLTTRWRWELLATSAAKNLKQLGIINALFQVMHFVVAEGVKIFCLLIALKFYTEGSLSLGQVIGTSFLIPKIFSPLQMLTTNFFQYLSIRPTLSMINDFIYSPVELLDETEVNTNQEKLMGGIEFQDVYFSYDLNPTLKGVSFRINPGEKIVIVGPTGSGKSAIANLMAGLYEPSLGQVVLDGYRSDQWPLAFIRSSFGLVSQEGSLFGGTIIENIALGELTPDFEKVQRVTEIVEMDEEILAKPGGYDFVLQPGGLGVSEGQKQRLLIARALYKDPSILLFDEATSYLDPSLEKRIVERVLRLYREKTIVFITHRTHLATKVDKVFYLENGSLKEGGSHHELITYRQRYYRFYVSHLGLG
ncbi:MAG: ATP-binding cassette domain-containing protein [Bdellovibrionaceae bacterium]|nr:ATP-binding cassette domain-containing protein [Pseudobdellovibrionaceae bacterium]